MENPISKIPFFVKAGAVLPLREVMQCARERDPEILELNVLRNGPERKAGYMKIKEKELSKTRATFNTEIRFLEIAIC